ncbi:hypothetical protein Pan54_13970 [Rubinisphaera italica]|uniref:Integrase catalytic domain-containing protein n=1 Tax=Rubinisphaera italica TaxID=2527969 RepID=A0A5C5XEE2_9PLAN|nr:hypothetical protein Pan54_13970 [Rubinisphaera italica]
MVVGLDFKADQADLDGCYGTSKTILKVTTVETNIACFLDNQSLYNECIRLFHITEYNHTMTAKIFHPLLAMIASSTNNELAKYVEYLKVENKILRARIPGQIHTKQEERERLLKYGKVIGRAIEELISIVSPAKFLRWVRDESEPKPKSPNLNSRSERFIQTIKYECLNKFIVCGKQHLDHLVGEFVDYYYRHRSSMVRDHLPPVREEPDDVDKLTMDECGYKL